MRAGEFPDGARTLRAKIDMASPNAGGCATRSCTASATRITTRPATRGASTRCTTSRTVRPHHIEGITHSICTLEFEVHRPLYDWLLEALDLPRPLPHQYEFARLNVTHRC